MLVEFQGFDVPNTNGGMQAEMGIKQSKTNRLSCSKLIKLYPMYDGPDSLAGNYDQSSVDIG